MVGLSAQVGCLRVRTSSKPDANDLATTSPSAAQLLGALAVAASQHRVRRGCRLVQELDDLDVLWPMRHVRQRRIEQPANAVSSVIAT